jgi:hypothetical protein
MGQLIFVNILLSLMAVQCSAQVDAKAWDAAAFQKGEGYLTKEKIGVAWSLRRSLTFGNVYRI